MFMCVVTLSQPSSRDMLYVQCLCVCCHVISAHSRDLVYPLLGCFVYNNKRPWATIGIFHFMELLVIYIIHIVLISLISQIFSVPSYVTNLCYNKLKSQLAYHYST